MLKYSLKKQCCNRFPDISNHSLKFLITDLQLFSLFILISLFLKEMLKLHFRDLLHEFSG